MPDLFDPDAAAAAVEASRTGRSPITPFTATWPDLEEAAAYDVAARVSRLRQVSTGAAPVGRKIGFTNRVMWPLLGVTQPMWGTMYGDTVVLAAGGTAEVDVSGFLEPRVEPEIVFRLARDLPRDATVDDVVAAVEWVAFGYEIVQSPYPAWRCRLADAIMAGGLHAASRVGPRHAPWPTMVTDLASFTLRLRRDSTAIGEGSGANVLDSPLESVRALLSVLGGVGLSAGEILTTGTITDAAPIQPGERYRVEIEGLPLTPLTLLVR